ncbi:MAG: hypothetical protein ABIF19_09240, partial [Planctomycetota bacterium]
LGKRIAAAAFCGGSAGAFYAVISAILSHNGEIIAGCVWRIFIFAVLATVGAVLTELKLPERA